MLELAREAADARLHRDRASPAASRSSSPTCPSCCSSSRRSCRCSCSPTAPCSPGPCSSGWSRSPADVTLQISPRPPRPGGQRRRCAARRTSARWSRRCPSSLRARHRGPHRDARVDDEDADDLARLCALHRGLGVSDDDHVVRPIIRRGRAETGDLGVRRPLPRPPARADDHRRRRLLVAVRADRPRRRARHRPAAHPHGPPPARRGRRDAHRSSAPARGRDSTLNIRWA